LHQVASFKAAFKGDEAVLQTELNRIENERQEIMQLLSPDHHRKLVDKGLKRLSFSATIAALMIHLSGPLLSLAFRSTPSQARFSQHILIFCVISLQQVRRQPSSFAAPQSS
jgi:hypothetical protein